MEVDEQLGSGVAPDPMLANPRTGEPTFNAIRAEEDAIDKQREGERWLIDEGIKTANTIFDVAVTSAISLGTAPEENFDAKTIPGLFDNLPAQFHREIAETDSTIEAWARRGLVDDYLENVKKLNASGYAGLGAQLAGGLIDADAVLIPVSGGTYLGPKLGRSLASMGIKDGRIAATAVGAARGLEAGAITGVAGATLGTTTDAGDVPSMVLGGMAFGSTLGAIAGKGAITNEMQLEAALRAHDQYILAKENEFKNPTFFSKESVGAARVSFIDTPTTLRDSTKPWFERATQDTRAVEARKVITGENAAETTNLDSVIGRTAQRAQNWVDKSPLKSLYTEVSNTGWVGNKLAYDLLYHPGGASDGNMPAALYDHMYTQELSLPIQAYKSAAMKYLNRPQNTMSNRAANAFTREADYRTFDRAVQLELETRYHDKVGDPNAHPAVKEFADEHDRMTQHATKVMQGKAGETPVAGSEKLEWKSGYYSRRWSGEAMRGIQDSAIVKSLTSAYMKLLPAGAVVDPSKIESIVKSIVTRSKAMDEGIDTNLIGLLRDNGKEFLRDTLKNNKIKDEDIESILSAFVGNAEERAKPGFLKGRIELDLRTPIEGTDKTLLDLLEPDFYKGMHMYTRKVAGTSALARKGYQLGDKTSIIESIKDELVANGKDPSDARIDDILETTFSYFGAGAVGKGVDPLLLSAMRATRQSLLGTLGLTQLSELGNLVSMVGVEAAMKAFPAELRALASGKMTPIVQEFHDALVFLDKDHILQDDQLALDVMGKSSIIQSQFMDGVHKTLAFGDKISGYTSLFYQAMSFSQRLALSGVNHKIYKVLSEGNLDAGAYRRLMDLGLDETMANRIQQYIAKGTIKYGEDGELALNFKDWAPEDLQEYKLAMHTFTARAVQRNLPGEVPYWFTTQFGQVMTQLRVFPIQAMQKQFLRNMRHADSATAASLLWNLGVAGLIYSTSETVKGRGGELTPEKIAKGAINYSPTTGWLPMVTDPVAEIMGMPELRMNKFGPPGRATDGIIPTPPVIPTMNRMAHIPGALLGITNGIDRNEAVSLSSMPIIGNTYGFSAMFNAIKNSKNDDDDTPASPAPESRPAASKKSKKKSSSEPLPTPVVAQEDQEAAKKFVNGQ